MVALACAATHHIIDKKRLQGGFSLGCFRSFGS